MFAPLNRENPSYEVPWMYDEGCVVLDLNNHPVKAYRDIPLTLSSKVEAALMEAIRRTDPRISMIDFWARLSVHLFLAPSQQVLIRYRPEECGKGGILTPNALDGRISRWRWENAVTAFTVRKGTEAYNDNIWKRMSPAARRENSTRELSKFSKAQLNEARKKNSGKHSANAGGWALSKEGQLPSYASEQDRPTHTAPYGDVTLDPSLNSSAADHPYGPPDSYSGTHDIRSAGNASSTLPMPVVHQGTTESPYWDFDPQIAPVFNTWPTNPNNAPAGIYLPEVDYRNVQPQNDEEINEIQIALSSTRSSYSQYFIGECPPTTRHQSYSYQVSELRSSFAQRWMSLGIDDFEMPSLQAFEEPWKNGFKDWMPGEALASWPSDQYMGGMRPY